MNLLNVYGNLLSPPAMARSFTAHCEPCFFYKRMNSGHIERGERFCPHATQIQYCSFNYPKIWPILDYRVEYRKGAFVKLLKSRCQELVRMDIYEWIYIPSNHNSVCNRNWSIDNRIISLGPLGRSKASKTEYQLSSLVSGGSTRGILCRKS